MMPTFFSRLVLGPVPFIARVPLLLLVTFTAPVRIWAAMEVQSTQVTVKVIDKHSGLSMPHVSVDVWLTTDLPGHGLSSSSKHIEVRTDENGSAKLFLAAPLTPYLEYNSHDFDSCPEHGGIDMTVLLKRGLIAGNTCPTKHDRVRTSLATPSAGELVILAFKHRPFAW